MDEKRINGKDLSQEKRMYKREKYEKIITYSTSLANRTFDYPAGYRMIMLEGRAIDISYGGLGMITSFELEPGKVLLLNDIEGQDVGIVKSSHMVSSDSYRVGIAFS